MKNDYTSNTENFLQGELAKGKNLDDVLKEIADAANTIKAQKEAKNDYSKPLNTNAKLMAAIANNTATLNDVTEIMCYLLYPLSGLEIEEFNEIAEEYKHDMSKSWNMIDEIADFLDQFGELFLK